LSQPVEKNRGVLVTTSIGIFDSGVGGLTVFRAIRELMPAQPVLYLADQANVPYGVRQLEEVRGFAKQITTYLISQGAKLIVVACNTASVAALKYLRQEFPEIPFVGMEPAVKPAAERTRTGVVGVLATYATFQGEVYASVVERFAKGVTLLQDPCLGLVSLIEQGDLSGNDTRKLLKKVLRPMLEKNIDTVVLGCTHYPFVIPLIKEIVGPSVNVIDPAPAVARQVQRLLKEHGWLAEGNQSAAFRLLTTGDPSSFETNLPVYLGYSHKIEHATWHNGRIGS
jgi:glutamate racemase